MAKKAIAYLATPADVIAMLVFKAGFRFLPQQQKDVLASMPIKAMKLDGEQFQELREKYFKQKANEVKGFVGTSKMVKEGLRMRLMDAKRTAILGKKAPNFEGTYVILLGTKSYRNNCKTQLLRELTLYLMINFYVLFFPLIVFDVTTREKGHILDFERRSCLPKQSRPLVLYFGSFT